jgi:phenylalanyl-tRNA synthetase beta chain
MQIQEKLAMTHGRNRKKSAYGLYPTDIVKFPINYIAKDPKTVEFWPLGMPKPMRADDVEELHPKGREYKWVAEGWKKYPFFIDSVGNVMSMLPYTNSNDTGKIDESTKEVFIECTGIDFENVSVALNIFVTMLADMGGEIYSLDIVYPDKTITTPDLTPRQIAVDVNYVNKKLGTDIKERDVKELLERMGYGYLKGNALVPGYRYDILHQIDLVEDIAIAYGYENFPAIIPKVATIAEEDKFTVFKRKVCEILVGLGMMECKVYHITNKEHQTKLMDCDIEVVELANALNQEYNTLTSWVVPSLMEVLKNNKHHEYPQNIFAISGIFKKDNTKETNVLEQDRLACILCADKVDYTRIKQVLDYLFRMIGIEYKIDPTEHKSFISGRVGRVSAKGKNLAYIGEISPKVIENWELEVPIAAFELNLSELFRVYNPN